MTRSLLSSLRAGSARKPAYRRRSFVPRLCVLEDRTLPSVQFTPAPYAVPGNRPDTALGRISGVTATLPVEPYLSVNPADPGDIAVSSQNGIRVSTTAGGSFTSAVQFQGFLGGGGDTSTTYDSAGRLFWVNLNPGTGITLAQVDPETGGILNMHAVDRNPEDDQGFIAADPSNNNLYVIWHRNEPDGIHIVMRYSQDQGATWSDLVRVDNGSDGFVIDPTVTVAPDHHVYAAYHSVTGFDATGAFDHSGKVVVVRYDNDLTNPVRSIAEVPGRADITGNSQTTDRRIPGAQFQIGGSAQPWILADPVRPGNIYVISADANNGFHQDYGDIRIARSTDSGLTWSSSLIETSSALFPNAAIDPLGDIVVAWYDNRRGLNNAAGHFKLDVYATYSTDGDSSFAPAFPVNDQTPGVNTPNGNIYDPDPGAVIYDAGPPPTTWIGEYFGIGIWGGTAYVAWHGNTFAGFDNPNGQQVWMKSFAIRGSLTITSTADTNNLIVRTMADNSAFVEAIVNGQRQYAGLWSALTSITVNATQGVNVVVIDDSVAGTPLTVDFGDSLDVVHLSVTDADLSTIQGPVIVHGGASSQVALHDDAYTANTTYTITGSSVSRPGSALVTFDHLGRFLAVFGGGGNDTYDVAGALQNSVSVFAQAGSNALSVDEGSRTADTTYTISGSSISWTGSSALSYSGHVTTLTVTGGNGNNTYNVQSTPSLSSTTLNTGSGADRVNVRATAGPLFLNSGNGGDTITLSNAAATLAGIGQVILNDPSNRAAVTVDDSFAGSTTYTITNTQVAAAAWPNFLLVYNNLASLNLKGSNGDSQFNIESTASGTATTVTAGSGSNRFDLARAAQYLAAVAGSLNLLGSGADTLVFWDQANPSAETYCFDDVPSTLALATVPGFATRWSGMAAVYLETNHMSTVDDPSGSVLVDLSPP